MACPFTVLTEKVVVKVLFDCIAYSWFYTAYTDDELKRLLRKTCHIIIVRRKEYDYLFYILFIWHHSANEMTKIIERSTRENIPFDMCAQRILKSACASAQSDQSFRCPHKETLYPWLSKNAHSEDSDQTAGMRSLNRIFAGCTCSNVRFSDALAQLI